ncbi:LexA family protein [Adlercreutzia caecimuris]|uniref:LexA family protein n=1 Tax=Adlercreutzia caecimuris TaxID=671266 RepID=UPI000EE3F3E5|nr:XRE family transcriptional regulator [Adlercreutzia caecimuris]NBJ66115.1 LexA family transcriptional regulator [Adlercreutzia caecimuris]
MAIADNIKRLRLKRDWTQEHLADLVGVTRSTVTQWETGWSQPRMGAVEKLAAAFGVSVADMVDDGQRELPRGAILPRKSKAAYAPLLGRVHAGDPQDPEVMDGPMVELPESIAEAHPRAYFLEVEGDCMDKVYPEGCLILVDPDREPANGSIAAVSIDGADYVMRRLLRTSNTMVLAPESFNPEHEDIVITASGGRTVELAGTVVWYQPSREME